MFSKGKKKGEFRFSLRPSDGAKAVAVAGDFSGWKLLPMRKQKNGDFTRIETLKPGTHEYKFIVDGQWLADPDNENYALNPYGTLNSVAKIG